MNKLSFFVIIQFVIFGLIFLNWTVSNFLNNNKSLKKKRLKGDKTKYETGIKKL